MVMHKSNPKTFPRSTDTDSSSEQSSGGNGYPRTRAKSNSAASQSVEGIFDNADFRLLRDAILDLLRVDLEHYKTGQMLRRLAALLPRRKVGSWREYVDRLKKDPAELAYLREYLTINVSSFYRDARKWDYLAEHVLPDLASHFSRGLQIWSAGCSIGAEPYTLAMLLQEVVPHRGHRIWATDIDDKVLNQARNRGPYTRSDIKELPDPLAAKYLVPISDEEYKVHRSLRTMIQFDRFDLLQDRTQRQFHLIVCRNVVIYFTPEIKEMLYRRFLEALYPQGILFIGGTETITQYRTIGFEYVAPSLYRRPAVG